MGWLTTYERRVSRLVLLSLTTLLVLGYGEETLANPPFTNASIRGTYALIDAGRSGGQLPNQLPQAQAGVGVVSYDGNGKFSGRSFQDVPLFGQQLLVSTSLAGTYEVNSDGTGRSILTITLQVPPTNPQEHQNLTLVITKSRTVGGARVADEFSLVQDQLGLPGTLTPFVATRLPPGGKFTNASFTGNYAFTLVGDGGFSPEAGLGVINYDGLGRASGTATVNLPDPPGSSSLNRKSVTTPFDSAYAMDPDGIGIVTTAGQSDARFVVTQAEWVNGVKVAREAFFVVRDLDPATGSLLTGVITKQSD